MLVGELFNDAVSTVVVI